VRSDVATQELKQIAGRAGRFKVGTLSGDAILDPEVEKSAVIEASAGLVNQSVVTPGGEAEPHAFLGEVLGMSKRDVSHIHECINATDADVTHAGLRPTMDLLKLMGILALKNRHADLIQGFFVHHETSSWHSSAATPDTRSLTSHLTLENISAEFGSLAQFLERFDEFLSRSSSDEGIIFYSLSRKQLSC
jgi:hypothetical protein